MSGIEIITLYTLDIATNSTKMSIDIIIIDIIYYLSGFAISVWRCYRAITSYYEVKCRSIRIRKQNYLCKLYSDSHDTKKTSNSF